MKSFIAIVIFIIGIAFIYNNTSGKCEGFGGDDCPDLLVQKGEELHLIYSNRAKIPGVNPIKFDNLEEYVEFMKWQRAKGIKCPILYFQQTYDAQNKLGYRMLPDPIEKQAGLSSFKPVVVRDGETKQNTSKQGYTGFDSLVKFANTNSPLTDVKVRNDAMSPNWDGDINL
jgi:hypothetical protein